MPFKLSLLSEDPAIAHLAAEGEITSADLPANASLFEAPLGSSWNSRRVLLDMDRVSYLDSSAIGWLINSQKAFRSAGGMLAMHSLQPQIHQMLNMLKVGRVVPITDAADAGRKVLAPSAN